MTVSAPPLLVGESFSPWTKKARWALEQCGLSFDYKEYIPTLSEPWLRWRLRQWRGSVSVPVLITDDEMFRDSLSIARHANAMTADRRLGDFNDITAWNDLSEAALAEGRTRVVRGVLNDDRALQEALPPFIPDPLRRHLRFMARDAVRRLDQKYAHLVEIGALRKALTKTRAQLAQVEGDFLLGQFSYADIAMAVVLEVIAPIAREEPPLGPVTQTLWHDRDLTEEFEDLVAWRNRLARAKDTTFSQFNCA